VTPRQCRGVPSVGTAGNRSVNKGKKRGKPTLMDISYFEVALLVLPPLLILFVVSRHDKTERLLVRFAQYSVVALLCGFLFVMTATLTMVFSLPGYEAYEKSVMSLLQTIAGSNTALAFMRISRYLVSAAIWYLGVFFGSWLVWRNRSPQRSKEK
jgi:hypothetical protein